MMQGCVFLTALHFMAHADRGRNKSSKSDETLPPRPVNKRITREIAEQASVLGAAHTDFFSSPGLMITV